MIKVMFFAHVKDKAGVSDTIIEQEVMSVEQIRSYLNDKYGIDESDRVMIAVNEAYAEDDREVRRGDIVAVIPPVSGG